MKKMMVALAFAFAMATVNAATVMWNVTGTADDNGKMVYLLTEIATSYDTVADFTGSAVASKGIAAAARGKYSTGDVTTPSEAVTKTSNYYLAIVDADSKGFTYLDVTAAAQAKVFDPQAQETAKGAFATALTSIQGGTHMNIGQAVPEPTSGLLLLLGMAGLALRRKQK